MLSIIPAIQLCAIFILLRQNLDLLRLCFPLAHPNPTPILPKFGPVENILWEIFFKRGGGGHLLLLLLREGRPSPPPTVHAPNG